MTAGPPVAPRDRDAAGRPRSARPRDRAGRPLPADSPAAADQAPDDLPVDGATALTLARGYLAEGRPFAAHEALEAAWKEAAAGERDLWHGLAQLMVALTHAQRGNAVGASRLFRRGVERLVGAEQVGAAYGVDIAAITGQATRFAERIERDGLGAAAAGLLAPADLGLLGVRLWSP